MLHQFRWWTATCWGAGVPEIWERLLILFGNVLLLWRACASVFLYVREGILGRVRRLCCTGYDRFVTPMCWLLVNAVLTDTRPPSPLRTHSAAVTNVGSKQGTAGRKVLLEGRHV